MLSHQSARASSSQYVILSFEKDDVHVNHMEDMFCYEEEDCDDDVDETASDSGSTTPSL